MSLFLLYNICTFCNICVTAFQCSRGNDGIYNYDPKDFEKGVGSKFGSVLEAIDIDGDGKDELFIGAPLYTGKHPEEGRVYVYTFENNVSMC